MFQIKFCRYFKLLSRSSFDIVYTLTSNFLWFYFQGTVKLIVRYLLSDMRLSIIFDSLTFPKYFV